MNHQEGQIPNSEKNTPPHTSGFSHVHDPKIEVSIQSLRNTLTISRSTVRSNPLELKNVLWVRPTALEKLEIYSDWDLLK
jgi:hypothetical protein